jgi:hypothetical protein
MGKGMTTASPAPRGRDDGWWRRAAADADERWRSAGDANGTTTAGRFGRRMGVGIGGLLSGGYV